MAIPERTLLRDHREYLARDLSGRVLDLGAGTGAMFPYFEGSASEGVSLNAIEPDPHMRRRARERARKLDLDVDVAEAGGENLPYRDDSFDIVVASFVFCTIPDNDRALSEVARVLEPGGEFRFVEHVRGDDAVGHAHDLFAPLWHEVAGGCHLNRETGELFLRDDRFRTVDFTRRNDGVTAVLPIVRGTLERRRDPSLLEQLRSRRRNSDARFMYISVH